MIRKKSPRVLLVLGWYDYRLHRGIEKYAQEHGWHLSEDVAREKVIPWGWEGDGILAWLGAGEDLADFVVQAKKPTVDFSYRRSQLKFTHVLEDTSETARLVTEHFLSRGFRNFAFYSDSPNWIYNERGAAFTKALEEADCSVQWLRWHESPDYCTDRNAWKRKRHWLAGEVKRLEKPVGVFAASDGLAFELLESCEEAKIGVPDQVAIVGAGNSLLAVDAMRTPISSVDVNLELIGYRGAQILDKLMQHRSAPAEPVRVPPSQLVVRKSSDLFAVAHAGVARSLRFMWEHCHEPIGVNDLAAAAAMSVRSYRQSFIRSIGRLPGAELQRVRIERAKKLIADTSEKIDTIAELCGYENSNSFWVAFKRVTGLSPRKYQKKINKGF